MLPGVSSMTSHMIGAVTRAYADFEARAQTWTARYQARGGRVHCAAGCFGCCDMPIRISLAEALTLSEVLPDSQFEAMRGHARKVLANARTARSPDQYVEQHRAQVGFCPLLDRENGRCTQYERRPTRCRDTFSALPARYCAAGAWTRMDRAERREYRQEVAATPGTDGQTHYIAPLEAMSEPVWDVCAREMRRAWGLEIWGDFAVLVALTGEPGLREALESRSPRRVWAIIEAADLDHPEVIEVG
jgi:Fe-S-cluster containining protein